MRRTGFARPTAEGLTQARLTVPVFRPKKCDTRKGGCGEVFTPARAMQKACSPDCARAFIDKANERKAARFAADERRATRAQLEALKTIPQLKKEAQQAFNRWIRQRDAQQPCISCGAPPPDLTALHAGRDAGHYRSTGSADHLRFHEDNCHAQCVKCNQWGAGMAVEYRIGLMDRIGQARLDALEHDNTPQKWTRDGLRELRAKYRALVRSMNRASA